MITVSIATDYSVSVTDVTVTVTTGSAVIVVVPTETETITVLNPTPIEDTIDACVLGDSSGFVIGDADGVLIEADCVAATYGTDFDGNDFFIGDFN